MRSVKSILKKIKGDASFRSFYRKKNNKKNSILVYATKEKEKNLLIYDAINSLLIENKILAPKLYKENYKQNFIEIEDFGDDTIFKVCNFFLDTYFFVYQSENNLASLNNLLSS